MMERARHASPEPLTQQDIEDFNESLVMPIPGITRAGSDRAAEMEGESFEALAAMMGA